jgi:V/A-type H+/Na+-transporting ATPase subunit D
MAIKIQYNKTALQQLNKQLNVRLRALPTLKSKESALRLEVKKAKDEAHKLERLLHEMIRRYDHILALWVEFEGSLLVVNEVKFVSKKIAGVKTPILEEVVFELKPFSLFAKPAWYLEGIHILKELTRLTIEKDFFMKKMDILSYARKKTTQKVNLYEKVQIPEFENGILRIKRFMEDEENLSKAAQKIVKSRQQVEAEV